MVKFNKSLKIWRKKICYEKFAFLILTVFFDKKCNASSDQVLIEKMLNKMNFQSNKLLLLERM